MIRWIGWGLFTLLVAAGLHVAAVFYAPKLIMQRVLSGLSGRGAVNSIAFTDRPTSASRQIVKPSPDLLYSVCVFDLTYMPVKVVTAAPTDTYWSVSLYADNTDNFFALNDAKANGAPATILLIREGQTVPPVAEGTFVVAAPTTKGLVLFRTLINDDAREKELDEERRKATCEPVR